MSGTKEIKSGKIFVKEIFKMWFRVPEYQRPYVWGDDQIKDLLEDLSYAALNTPNSEYFLGSIVFQEKQPGVGEQYSENDLLDGQQRLTTLFLLMAVARDITSDPNLKTTCQSAIFQKGNPFENIPEIIRIQFKIRKDVEDFIDEFVKIEGGTLRDKDLLHLREKANDLSIRNMANAIIAFKRHFNSEPSVPLEQLFIFLLNKVLLIYVSSEELEDAFRLFTILNDRGVKLRNSDILKAINLKALSTEADQQYWAKYWEELEGELEEDFDRFMSWIRTIVVKEKARLGLLKEFDDVIYDPKEKDKSTGLKKQPLLTRGTATFNMVKSYYNHYNKIFSKNNYDFTNSWHFDNLVTTMNTGIPSNDWVPVLLFYYDRFKSENIYRFLQKLDNKFSGDWIGGYSPTERIEAMNWILKEIESASSSAELLNHPCFDVDLENLFRNIEGKVYGRQFVRYLLLKIDFHYLDNYSIKVGAYDALSIEHILPQNPEKSSKWCTDFNEDQRAELTNKLGNLILLGRRKNSSQGRLDYIEKKAKYFSTNINTFPNSIRVINQHPKWQKDDLASNQQTIIKILKRMYGVPDLVTS